MFQVSQELLSGREWAQSTKDLFIQDFILNLVI